MSTFRETIGVLVLQKKPPSLCLTCAGGHLHLMSGKTGGFIIIFLCHTLQHVEVSL